MTYLVNNGRLEMDKLNKEYTALEVLANEFQNNNEEYIKFTRSVEQKVFGILSDKKTLLVAID
jgi:hypothetical protein